MRDMCENTGAWLEGDEAVLQSVRRTIRIRLGSLILNRSFGSKARDFLQRPVEELKAHLSQEIFISLAEKVPAFIPERVVYVSLPDSEDEENGVVEVNIEGTIEDRKVIADAVRIRA